MPYDRDGFPIPPAFESPRRRGDEWIESGGTTRVPEVSRDRSPARGAGEPAPAPRRGWRGGKSALIVLVLALWIVPALVGPALLPLVRPLVVQWSVERSLQFEAEDDVDSALVELDRAIDWVEGDDPALLCQRAWLKLHGGNPGGAVDDARRAEAVAPRMLMPLRVRGLAEVVRGNAEQALADARLVVERSAPRDPDALNHRAYVRALVARELPDALADIDAAIDSAGPAVTADILDTRGFILHLLGRDEEALEQMEEAIGSMLEERRRVRLVAGRGNVDRVLAELRLRTIEHSLAVMYHHRGLIHRQEGRDDLAGQDFAAAKAKGYDPARGVF